MRRQEGTLLSKYRQSRLINAGIDKKLINILDKIAMFTKRETSWS